MSSIIGSAEMLADGMLGEMTSDQRHLVDVIARNGDRLLALADDLLMLASADNGTWQQQQQPVDLRAVARESIGAVSTTLTSRRLSVRAELPEEPVTVHGDPVHLERAVTNLLTNAVKFTPDDGEIVVGVAAQNGHAHVAVRDTGIGIAADDIEAVFGKFFRSSVVQQRAIQGSGLGLSIVKTIVESHDGHVEVESAPGQGTTFTIILPRVHRPVAVGSPLRSRPSATP
jgi:signal transduction histidine kinase